MKSLIFIFVVLFSTVISAETLKVSKDKLAGLQKDYLRSQETCRIRQEELRKDPFIVNLDAEMDEGVKTNRISSKYAQAVKEMITVVLMHSDSLCSDIDRAVAEIDKEMKSETETSSFSSSLTEIEGSMLTSTQQALRDIIDLSMSQGLSNSEMGNLRVIGGIMMRSIEEVAQQ